MVAADDTSIISPVAQDLTSTTAKYVILPGCVGASLQANPLQVTASIEVAFSNIRNPYSVRETSPFLV